MAKKTGGKPAPITKEQIRTGGVFINAADFGKKGEVIAGLNILKLRPGEAAGPFTLKAILPKQRLGSNRAMKPVDVYVATHNGLETRMPAAASFTTKAHDANLAVGDVFNIMRGDDYVSKAFHKPGASYLLEIISRAKGKK